MKRSELEHLIRAAGRIAGGREIVVIGSQAVLGQFPDAPVALLASMEADLYPRNDPGLADEVDGAIGEGSRFHEQYGYYAQGVGPDTATLPAAGSGGWCVSRTPIRAAMPACAWRCTTWRCRNTWRPRKGPRVHARARASPNDGQEGPAQAASGDRTRRRALAGGARKDRADFAPAGG